MNIFTLSTSLFEVFINLSSFLTNNSSSPPQLILSIARKWRRHKLRDLGAQLAQIDCKFVPSGLSPHAFLGAVEIYPMKNAESFKILYFSVQLKIVLKILKILKRTNFQITLLKIASIFELVAVTWCVPELVNQYVGHSLRVNKWRRFHYSPSSQYI